MKQWLLLYVLLVPNILNPNTRVQAPQEATEALQIAQEATKVASIKRPAPAKKQCKPCEGKIKKFNGAQENTYIQKIPGWKLHRDGIHKISRTLAFANFEKAMQFINTVAIFAEEQGHHPS